MLYRFLILPFFAVLLTVCAGCSQEEAPDPPLARAELTVRLNEALKLSRYSEAVSIIDKLLALDPDDADLMEMRDRIIGNICVEKTQRYVNSKNLNKALAYVKKQRRQYPMLPRLQILEAEVASLITMRDAATELARAQTIAELTAALEKITPLAAAEKSAVILQQDIRKRRSELAAMRKAAAEALEKAAQQKAAAEASTAAPAGEKAKPAGEKTNL